MFEYEVQDDESSAYLPVSLFKTLLLTNSQAVGQLCSTANMAHNLIQCQILVQKAVAAGAKVVLEAIPCVTIALR